MGSANRPPKHHTSNRWPYFRVRCSRLMPIFLATLDFVGSLPCFRRLAIVRRIRPVVVATLTA